LKVFNSPYLQTPEYLHLVRLVNSFDYDEYNKPLQPTEFGQPNSVKCTEGKNFIDRNGKRRCELVDGHPGHDWVMQTGMKIMSVADGIVRETRLLDVSKLPGDCAKKSPQAEVFIEHKVGTGEYAERFLTYYAHLSVISVHRGMVVTRGQQIGKSGDTGCSSEPHLHFGVLRLTNLSSYRSLDLTFPKFNCGISAVNGAIDPFGWNAPRGVDPRARAFLGRDDRCGGSAFKDPGAFSIYLWRNDKAPLSD
jgi:murein DD-endopeptidase MepM/ murein hydrolase activator NlpD